jgi:hypothetical protein
MKSGNKNLSPVVKNRIQSKRLPDIRRLLNKIINLNLQGQMSNDQLRAITYATQSMAKVFELMDVEARLDRIEKEAKRGK